jgi:hypothetical protein
MYQIEQTAHRKKPTNKAVVEGTVIVSCFLVGKLQQRECNRKM